MIVLRSTHAAIVAAEQAKSAVLKAEVQRLREELASIRDREDRLMHQYVALAQPKPAVVLPVREPDPVQGAIRRRAAGNTALQQHLAFWARAEKERGADVADIVKRIDVWVSGDDADSGEPVLPW